MLLGILNSQAAGGGSSYWLATLGGASNDYGRGIVTDSSGNSYVVGLSSSTGAGGSDSLLVKYESSGAVLWQRSLGQTGAEEGLGVALDSANNVYIAGLTTSQGAGSNDVLIAKYNSSGTLQWQRVLGGTGAEFGISIALDSEGNAYILGKSTIGGILYFLLAKYNSSGTLQWQRTLGGSGADDGEGIAIDSSNNIYLVGATTSAGAGSRDFLIAKYNSSGTLQWQRILGSVEEEFGRAITLDNLGNLYLTGYGFSTGRGNQDILIAKYNSSGTIQWQRRIASTGNEAGAGLAFHSGTIYVTGNTNATGEGGYDVLLAKLPSDGSLTGTYVLDGVDMVYSASSLTAATSTLTASTSTLTAATSTLTAATSTLTDSTATLTSHFVTIPA